jgi:hypothetical protein
MYRSIWIYPWDLADLGTEACLQEIKEAGLNGVSIASSYHAGRFLQPRNPRRKVYFPEDGTLYFPIDRIKYDSLYIQPKVASVIDEHGDILEQTIDCAKKLDLHVSAWTVCLHNTRIGMQYPDVVIRNAFGDPYFHSLCPNNPHVRAYITTFISDMATRYNLHAIELESLSYMGYAHGFHHEKDGVGLTKKEEFLLSLCFCDACKQEALSAHINFEEARFAVQTILTDSLDRAIPENDNINFANMKISDFQEHHALYAYLQWRSVGVTTLIKEVRDVIPAQTKLHLICSGSPSQLWMFGLDFAEIQKTIDGFIVCCYNSDRAQVARDIQLYMNVASDKEILTGLRVFVPELKLGIIDNGKLRKLTIREGLRLFGFPDNFKLDVNHSDAYDLLGNTVVVKVIEMVSERVLSG